MKPINTINEMKHDNISFVGKLSDEIYREGRFFKIPAGIKSEEELFLYYSKHIFMFKIGIKRWEAFADCLLDMSWVPQRNVHIIHDDIPLLNNERTCQIYLETLVDVIYKWNQPRKLALGGEEYVDHRLFVTFPESARIVFDRLIS